MKEEWDNTSPSPQSKIFKPKKDEEKRNWSWHRGRC